MEELVKLVQASFRRDDLPTFKSGDTLDVYVRIKEGDKERTQLYTGVCLQRRGKGATETFTVRKISGGVGVERIFPVHSPSIEKIEVKRRAKVRRARLFYLRGKVGKHARLKEATK
jgi:large subunit ribosomal protein L19